MIWSPGQETSMSVWLSVQLHPLFLGSWPPIQEHVSFWSSGPVQEPLISFCSSTQPHFPWTKSWLLRQIQTPSCIIWSPGQPLRCKIKNNQIVVKDWKREKSKLLSFPDNWWSSKVYGVSVAVLLPLLCEMLLNEASNSWKKWKLNQSL